MPSDPSSSMETFAHVNIISSIIGIIIFIGLFSTSYNVYLRPIKSNTTFYILSLLTFIVIGSYTSSYILYAIQILNIDGTLQVGKKALSFCGKNIYVLDTGEYKAADGFINFANSNVHSTNNKLLKISNLLTNILLSIFYVTIIIILVSRYYISAKIKDEISNIIIYNIGRNTIKDIVIYLYTFIIISGILSTSVLLNIYNNTNNSSLKSKDDINKAYTYAPLSSILLLSLLMTVPFNNINLSTWKLYFSNFIELLVYKDVYIIIIILLIFTILTIFLNNLITSGNNKLTNIFNNDYINKYIYVNGNDINDDTLEGNLNKLCFINNIKNTDRSEINTIWIDYFKKNIKNAFANTDNQIFGDDDSIVLDYKDDLWKYIQFNNGKEFDDILLKINDYIDKNNIDISLIPSMYNNLLVKDKKGITCTTSSTSVSSSIRNPCGNKQIIEEIIDSLNVITNIRKICYKLRNDKTISNNIYEISKKFMGYSLLIVCIVLYIVIHTIVKSGNRNILNYMVFIAIIFAVVMGLYGWGTGFTYV